MTAPFDDYTPEQAQRELLELIVKVARRCAYDLRHAADDMSDKKTAELFHSRAATFLTIFDPADGGKNYRHRLHNEIDDLATKVSGLRQLCKDNNIECGKYDDFPF